MPREGLWMVRLVGWVATGKKSAKPVWHMLRSPTEGGADGSSIPVLVSSKTSPLTSFTIVKSGGHPPSCCR